MNSILKECIAKKVEEYKKTESDIVQIRIKIFEFFKNSNQSNVDKILKELKMVIPKPKEPKKVNRINANDERVKDRELGVYAWSESDRMESDGFQNKCFWQCATCLYIHNQRAAAQECYLMHNEIRTIGCKKPKEIGQLIKVDIQKRWGRRLYTIKVEGKILREIYKDDYIIKYEYQITKRLE